MPESIPQPRLPKLPAPRSGLPRADLRIGLFGGAFDPPHNAHIALARAAVHELGLARLHITPTGQAWHKNRPLTPAAQRLAMCRLAFAHEAHCVVDACETRRSGPSYTIDTLMALQAQYPGAALYLQMGADQAAAFHTWKDAARILEIATLCVAIRAGQEPGHAPFDPQRPLPGLPPAVQAAARVHVLRLPASAISSTRARQLAAQGQPLHACVPPQVARYIACHHLYAP